MGACYRTPEQEAAYQKQGLSHTTHSMHEARMAIDLNIFINRVLCTQAIQIQDIGAYWVSLATTNRWGGDWNKNGSTTDETFPDIFHFEMQPTR